MKLRFHHLTITKVQKSLDLGQKIIIEGGCDDRCRQCDDFDGLECTKYSAGDLEFEDERTQRDFFPELNVGDEIEVLEATAIFKRRRKEKLGF